MKKKQKQKKKKPKKKTKKTQKTTKNYPVYQVALKISRLGGMHELTGTVIRQKSSLCKPLIQHLCFAIELQKGNDRI